MEVWAGIRFTVLDMTVVEEAERLIEVHSLKVRTLDLLQLASASLTHKRLRQHEGALRFCTADKQQAEAARILFGIENTQLVGPA